MSTGIPEAGRIAAHTLLDAVAALQLNAGRQENVDALNLALGRLSEAGAVQMTQNGQIDADDLVGGALVLIHGLVLELARCRGVDVAEVMADARAVVDRLQG